MRCSYSRAAGTRDTFGQMTGWGAATTNVACYWWAGTPSRSGAGETPAVVATEQEHLLVDRSTDIRQGDRITQVVDHLGRTVFSATDYRMVEHVTVQRNHLDCTLRYAEPIGGRA